MVDMRHPAPGGGESPAVAGTVDSGRRRLLRGLAAVGGGLLTGTARAVVEIRPGGPHLLPDAMLTGARLIQRPTDTGLPDFAVGGIGPLTQFVFPVAVAMTAMRDLYVADAGLGAIFRIDPALGAMNQIRGIRVVQQTRLAVAADGSLVVANGAAAPMVRITRGGRVMQTIDARLGGGSFYDEIAVDPNSGRYYGLDKVQRRLEEIVPQGGSGIVLPTALIPELPTAMAMDSERIYIAGGGCHCLVAIEPFASRNMEIFAEGVGLAQALAAGEGWVALTDTNERLLRVWYRGALLVEAEYASLGLIDPRGLAIAQRMLYVADGAGRRVVSFRLRA